MKTLRKIDNKWLVGVTLFIFVFVVSLQTSNNIWKNDIPATDSGVFLYIGKMITKDLMPYKDTFDHKGPLLYLINALGYFISPLKGIWLIELFFLFITAICIYKESKLFIDTKKSLLVTAVCFVALSDFFEGGNLTEEYAMPFIAYSIFVFTDYFFNAVITKKRLILTGLSFAAVCMLRINMISVWIVFCLAVLVECFMKKEFKNLGFFILWFLVGACILLLPIVFWLGINGAFWDFIEDYFIFNMQYSGDSGGIKNIVKALLYFYQYPVITLAIVTSVFNLLKSRKKFDFYYVIFLSVTMLMMCMSGRTYPHYAMVMIPILVYPIGILIKSFGRFDAELKMKSNFVIVLICIVFLLPNLTQMAYSIVRRHSSDDYEAIYKISDLIKEVTTPEDKISVVGNGDSIYLLSDRDSVSKYSYQSPIGEINPQISVEYYEDLVNKRPKVIVLNDNVWNYDVMNTLVNDNGYELIATENVESSDIYSCYVYLLEE